MVTQQWINGYLAALKSLRYSLVQSLLQSRKERVEGTLSLSDYKCTVKGTLSHLKVIKGYKSDLKTLITKLNKQTKIIP